MRARTRQELADTLRRTNVPAEAAEAVLDRMTEVGLINDAELARSWVESRQQRRYLSRTALRHELQRKGVERDVVAEAVDEVSGDDEREAARALAQKKLRSLRGLEATVQRRRMAGALARRGFTADVVAVVLKELRFAGDESDADESGP